MWCRTSGVRGRSGQRRVPRRSGRGVNVFCEFHAREIVCTRKLRGACAFVLKCHKVVYLAREPRRWARLRVRACVRVYVCACVQARALVRAPHMRVLCGRHGRPSTEPHHGITFTSRRLASRSPRGAPRLAVHSLAARLAVFGNRHCGARAQRRGAAPRARPQPSSAHPAPTQVRVETRRGARGARATDSGESRLRPPVVPIASFRHVTCAVSRGSSPWG
jgi:hypothetical protein